MEEKTTQAPNGFGIAGFVLGIISLIVFPFALGIAAIIFGAIDGESGLGKAAIVIGIISVIYRIIVSCAYGI